MKWYFINSGERYKMKFSVLMSIYKKEKPEYLQKAMESILHQTQLPDEIVIVEDGPLTSVLYKMLASYEEKYPIIRRIPFSVNRGLGLALRDGVIACSYEWIARMDTDDISKPDRFEKQIAFLESHPDIALLGTAIEEFSTNENHPDSITILPQTCDEILKFAKKRNPFRHMTMMYKRSAVLASGNYQDMLWFEDYDLFVRMLHHGYKGANLPNILVSVRADTDMFARRGGWRYFRQDIRFQHILRALGFIDMLEYVENIAIRGVVRMLPNKFRTTIYKVFLRQHI